MHKSMIDLRKRKVVLPDGNTMIELNLSIAGSALQSRQERKKRNDPSAQEGINEDIYCRQ
jgi:hypothetical protein